MLSILYRIYIVNCMFIFIVADAIGKWMNTADTYALWRPVVQYNWHKVLYSSTPPPHTYVITYYLSRSCKDHTRNLTVIIILFNVVCYTHVFVSYMIVLYHHSLVCNSIYICLLRIIHNIRFPLACGVLFFLSMYLFC